MAQDNPSFVSIIGPIQAAAGLLSSTPSLTTATSDTYTQKLLEAIVILLSDLRQNMCEENPKLYVLTPLSSDAPSQDIIF